MTSKSTSGAVPRLLVSVRSAEEVAAAVSGGADIIDVKEPLAGSLGRSPAFIVEAVAAVLARRSAATPLSVALGELCEWADDAPRLPASVRWVKLGLAGCARHHDWIEDWLAVRRQVTAANPQVKWIAVAYADSVEAAAPAPQDVLHAAIETGCAGVLIDTFGKRRRGLCDWFSAAALSEWIDLARKNGLQTAVAGSLRQDDLPWLLPLQPDIVAIRGAACQGGERTSAIDAAAVARFGAAMSSGAVKNSHPILRPER